MHRLRLLRQVVGAVHAVAGWPSCLLSIAMEAALEAGFRLPIVAGSSWSSSPASIGGLARHRAGLNSSRAAAPPLLPPHAPALLYASPQVVHPRRHCRRLATVVVADLK
jgi:hypothetical protein